MQTPDHQPPPEDEALQAPPRLVAALKRRPREPIFVAPGLDAAILRAAQRHLNPPQPVRRFYFWRWVAAGMVLLVLALIPQFFKRPASEAVRSANFARQDLNRDGRVDILDAFALARELRAGTARNPQLDVNGDGVVDERDVAVLAARAVKLEKGGAS